MGDKRHKEEIIFYNKANMVGKFRAGIKSHEKVHKNRIKVQPLEGSEMTVV